MSQIELLFIIVLAIPIILIAGCLLVIAGLLGYALEWQARTRLAEGRCESCGYKRASLPICPECGASAAPTMP